ncbi:MULTISPECIES: helix-turn-helix domain-containing protein [Photorhabdus]|uniref:Regulatory protein cro n=2 Tax=Photorhabdus asymbiotica TaxID=291112 RepID=C7BKG3_PHOAA|nr:MULTISPECIES: YdaS family helix-turn-helix protein [Photorhabdus]MCC8463857.1 helix-turn-helix domain-containing protein [Photorhabdus bodei]RKS59517.1 hypothetical protein BDD30_1593 [Photorhabdus asymbiotica]CAQ85660.1 regulatory protein cro [Photorhabdus asymbiotica]
MDIDIAIKDIGVSHVATACGVTKKAVYKWLEKGSLPKTEFFEKTTYAITIEKISKGKYLAKDLLEASKRNLLAE